MSTFLLIHGGWHGSWCWDKVIPLLEKEGHKVLAPDLPGSGKDTTPIENISLQGYTEYVCRVLDSQSEPVILVGHSMAGIIVSQTAEARPDKIQALCYLSAFLLRDGEVVLQHTREDTENLVLPNAIRSEDQRTIAIKPEGAKDVFYGDCSDADVQRAISLLKPQATAPLATPVRVTETNFGRVPRIYITTLRDRAITPSAQRKMYSALPCKTVLTMDTGHSPFFSAPEALVKNLLAAQG